MRARRGSSKRFTVAASGFSCPVPPTVTPTAIARSRRGAARPVGSIVGRDAAHAQLSHASALAQAGTRQIVFLTGEPGIGKTALVEEFLSRLAERNGWRIARADCVAQYGAGEAYRPLLEALTRLCRQEDDDDCIALLRRYAPTWLAQLPAFQTAAELSVLRRRSVGVTRDRMLRELIDALEAMSARGPIALCLEDLHWSDASTLDWIASFARRPERAAVLLLGTYRPGETANVLHSPESIADSLRVKGLCTEIPLAQLGEQDVLEDVARALFRRAGLGRGARTARPARLPSTPKAIPSSSSTSWPIS